MHQNSDSIQTTSRNSTPPRSASISHQPQSGFQSPPVPNNSSSQQRRLSVKSQYTSTFCGLPNCGNTGYLNSTIQQLYWIPQFRNLFLSSNSRNQALQALQSVLQRLSSS
jgi:ubiquitin C-terminal hydrolase